tara:strand:- start:294 stop:506 length:213 start_codon:yes stop_codon:yes gene_type:complete
LSPTVEVVLAPRIDVKISSSIAITLRALPLAPAFIVVFALSPVARSCSFAGVELATQFQNVVFSSSGSLA